MDLGDVLFRVGTLNADALERSRRLHHETNERFHDVLIRLGLVPERELAAAVARELSLDLVTRDAFPREVALPDTLSARFLRHVKAIPITVDTGRIRLAMVDPVDEDTV